VPIPRRFLLVHDHHRHQGNERVTAEGEGEGGFETVPVDYVFAGLELRHAVATDYDGWRLAYTAVEGGKSRGARAELSLESVAAASSEGTTGVAGEDDGAAAAASSQLNAQSFLAALSKLSHDFGFWANR
jgi:hypothetical protein